MWTTLMCLLVISIHMSTGVIQKVCCSLTFSQKICTSYFVTFQHNLFQLKCTWCNVSPSLGLRCGQVVDVGPSWCAGLFDAGSQDCSVRLWELSTGRCMRTLKFEFPVKDVAWNPNSSSSTVAAAVYVFDIFELFVCRFSTAVFSDLQSCWMI